jgi:hypothetical protein
LKQINDEEALRTRAVHEGDKAFKVELGGQHEWPLWLEINRFLKYRPMLAVTSELKSGHVSKM